MRGQKRKIIYIISLELHSKTANIMVCPLEECPVIQDHRVHILEELKDTEPEADPVRVEDKTSQTFYSNIQ